MINNSLPCKFNSEQMIMEAFQPLEIGFSDSFLANFADDNSSIFKYVRTFSIVLPKTAFMASLVVPNRKNIKLFAIRER